MDKPIFYEGQAVGCLMNGEGVVLEIKESMVTVRFKDDLGVDDFFNNGAWLQHQRPTLYPIEQYRAIIANLPAPEPEKWQPKPGEWCCFWNDQFEFFVVGKFDKKTEGLEAHHYTMLGNFYSYMHCAPFRGELPEHLKEVQP